VFSVPFKYDAPPQVGALRQGELLGEIWEHRPEHPPTALSSDASIQYRSVRHPLVMVMNPDCDLEWDFQSRFPDESTQSTYTPAPEASKPNVLISHVLLCDVYEKGNIINRVPPGRDIWKRIEQNQDERYHHFPPASVCNSLREDLPDLFLDFKKVFGLPTESLYGGLRIHAVSRIALVPPIYIHDLTHRFYGFLSRVGLPE